MKKRKAAIFDLDGTLINSLADLADSANLMLRYYGFPEHKEEAYRYFVGNGSKALIERCLPEKWAKDSAFVKEALGRYKEIYIARILEKTCLYDGILPMLERLQSMDIPMGICTNKHQSAADKLVEALFPKGLFQCVIGDRDGLPRKPDPKKVQLMADAFGITPKDVAYLGDSGVDMDTARNAGFYAIGVLWGFRPKEELAAHGAAELLETPMDLFKKIVFVR